MQTIPRYRRRRTAWSLAVAAIGLCLVLLATAPVANADEAKAPATPPEQSGPPEQSVAAEKSADGGQFEDPVENFVPLRPRSPREDDHIRALALFAAGRVAVQKQNYAEALRNYERAYRFDPDAVAALREIVPLAFNLDRQEEGGRDALILAEREPGDANLLRRLAMYLTEEGDTERALGLYEKAVSLQQGKSTKDSANTVLMWMEMGRLYFVAKKFEPAADNFARVAKALADPKEYQLSAEVEKALLNKGELTYQLFGEAFLEANRPDDALAAFEKVNGFKADEALHLYNLARVDAKRKQPAQALAKLEVYLDKHFATQGTGPYELYAEVLAALGHEDQLAERLEKYREVDAQNMPLSYFLAERYSKAGQLDKARPILEALIEQRKERPPLEAIRTLVDVYRQQQETARLLSLLGSSVGRVANLSPLGDSGDKLLADKALAAAIVAEAEKQLPPDGEVPDNDQPAKLDYGQWMAAALLAGKLENHAAADKLFDAAMKAEGVKPGEALVSWGLELFAANQYERAIKIFERAISEKALPDDNPALSFYLAGALEMAGRTDDAIARAKLAAEKKPDSPRFASRVAWIQFHAKQLDQARESYLALIDQYDKDHESPETREVMRDARLVLSNIAAMQGDMDQAEEWLEQVLDEFPEDAGALNDLGYLWADAGKHLERALAMIQVAVSEDPKNMAYRDSLGWALFRLGRYPEAIAELKVAASVPEADGVILDHLAEAQLLSGEIAAAIETWRRAEAAFERDGETEDAQEVREKLKLAEAQATKKAAVPEPKPEEPQPAEAQPAESPPAELEPKKSESEPEASPAASETPQ